MTTLDTVIAEAEGLKTAGRTAEAATLYESWLQGNDSPARCVALFNLNEFLYVE